MTESGRERFNHPQLTPEENALQRGGDPQPPHHDAAPTKPTYRSDPARRATLKGMLPSIFERRRFRQDPQQYLKTLEDQLCQSRLPT